MTIAERIKEIIKALYNGNVKAFADDISVARTTISMAIQRNTSVQSDLVEKILRTNKDINASWLLTGEGEMLKSKEQREIKKIFEKDILPKAMAKANAPSNPNDLLYIKQLEGDAKLLEERIKTLESNVNSLESENDRLASEKAILVTENQKLSNSIIEIQQKLIDAIMKQVETK